MHLPDQKQAKLELGAAVFVPKDTADAARWLLEKDRRRFLLTYCMIKMGKPANTADAEDVLQDFLLNSLPNVCRAFDPDHGTTFWSYFLTSLTNACRRQSRKMRQRASQEEPFYDSLAISPGGATFNSDETGDSDIRAFVERAKVDLDSRTRRAIEMRHYEDRGIDEIANALDVSESNAKIILFRGRQQLAQLAHWEKTSLLRRNHVRDWQRFCLTLVEAKTRVTVAGILWHVLDISTQDHVGRLAETTEDSLVTHSVADILSAVNGALPRRDLWPSALLATISTERSLSAEGHKLLSNRAELGTISYLRLNRLILELGFAGLVHSPAEGSDHE